MKQSPRLIAILQALLVTLLWSFSWVLIKIGLEDIPALTFAGLRYGLAFLCLLPFAWRRGELGTLRRVSPAGWGRLIILGLVYYTATQGGVFLTLVYLPSATFSMLLNFTVVIVAIMGIAFLGERVTRGQWGGLTVFLGGVLVYFYPLILPAGQMVGFLAAGFTVTANALSAILGRAVNRTRSLSPLAVTTASMGVGSAVLLLVGLLVEPFPRLTWQSWLLIIWLAVVHTAFTFTLWNKTLQTLSASESSIINNTMLIQISLLAWIFLGEELSALEIVGLVLAAVGIFIFQWYSENRA